MKPLVRVAVFLILLCLSACALGQDLKTYRMLGNIVPHGSAPNGKHSSSLLIYKNRGILFHVSSGRGVIMSADVFPPAVPPQSPPQSVQTGDVIPGAGAYGVALGMSMDQARLSPYLKDGRLMFEDRTGAGYDLGERRMLLLFLSDGKVSGLSVHGPIRTLEGISEGHGIADIQVAYGPPDEYYDIAWRGNPTFNPLFFLITPLTGIAVGLFLRWSRSRMEGTGGMIGWMAAFGAVGMALSAAIVNIALATRVAMEIPIPGILHLLWGPALIGAACVFVLETIPARIGGFLGALMALIAMLVVALIGEQIMWFLSPIKSQSTRLVFLALLDAPFILCMFLAAGRPKKT